MKLPAIRPLVFSAALAALLLGLSVVHWWFAYAELFHGDVPTGVLFLVVGSVLYVATLRVVYAYVLDPSCLTFGRKPEDPSGDMEDSR